MQGRYFWTVTLYLNYTDLYNLHNISVGRQNFLNSGRQREELYLRFLRLLQRILCCIS